MSTYNSPYSKKEKENEFIFSNEMKKKMSTASDEFRESVMDTVNNWSVDTKNMQVDTKKVNTPNTPKVDSSKKPKGDTPKPPGVTTSLVGTGMSIAQATGEDSGGWDPLGDIVQRVEGTTNTVSGTSSTLMAVGDKFKNKAATKAGEKIAESAIGKVSEKINPFLTIGSGIKDIVSSKTTGVQKMGGAATTAFGVAMTNFWNPAGWVAGALAVGGTLMSAFGGSNFKPQRFRRF